MRFALAAVWLRRHPLAIRTTLHDCITLTYALPAAVLRPMLPPGLELETIGDDGFVAIAVVQARGLRPAGLPAALGQDFFLAGYRIFTRFRNAEGRSLRGLRILRTDTDRPQPSDASAPASVAPSFLAWARAESTSSSK